MHIALLILASLGPHSATRLDKHTYACYSSSSEAMKKVGQEEIDNEILSLISHACRKLHQVYMVLKRYNFKSV